jgi:hypothetical protein
VGHVAWKSGEAAADVCASAVAGAYVECRSSWTNTRLNRAQNNSSSSSSSSSSLVLHQSSSQDCLLSCQVVVVVIKVAQSNATLLRTTSEDLISSRPISLAGQLLYVLYI